MAVASMPSMFRAMSADPLHADGRDRSPPSNLAACAADRLTVQVARTRAEFDALEADWNDLFERAGRSTQAFQAFNWLWHWANHFLDPVAPGRAAPRETALAIVTVRRGGRLVLVWPLVQERTAGLKCLTWMGMPVCQYGDILLDARGEQGADGHHLIATAWTFIRRTLRPDVVRLRKVRSDAAIAPFLARIGALTSEHQSAPFLDLSSATDFDSYEQRYSSKARKNRRRQSRRLEEQGPVRFEVHHGGPNARRLATQAVALKRDWLSARGLVSPALLDDRTSAFIADVAEATSHPTGCRVSALSAAGTPSAIDIAFACKGRMLVHVIVYNPAFEKAGAGNLLLEASARDAKAAGFSTFDLLAPGDAYKMEWADGAVAVADHAIPVSVAGRAYTALYLGYLRGRLKSAVRRLPKSLRRTFAAALRTTP